MLFSEFSGMQLSALGFGGLRLPLDAAGDIDEAATFEMVDYAIGQGINYFDTAYMYQKGMSEVVLGKALARHPKEKWHFATKFPGYRLAPPIEPQKVFEEQLVKCGMDSFDFYLIHDVNENSIKTYTDPRWDIIGYLVKEREEGRIGHLGVSCHARPDTLRQFLDEYGQYMEYVQIQLNYLDWTLQDAKGQYEEIVSRGLPVWVMEPLRGGKLADLPTEHKARLRELRPQESDAGWGFRFLQSLPSVQMVLSGMSTMEQLEQNVETFRTLEPTTGEETAVLFDIAETLKDAIPCTACRYCCDRCPQGLDIPLLLHAYNDYRFMPESGRVVMDQLDALGPGKQPADCVGCGACARECPQGIHIPDFLAEFAETLAAVPDRPPLPGPFASN